MTIRLEKLKSVSKLSSYCKLINLPIISIEDLSNAMIKFLIKSKVMRMMNIAAHQLTEKNLI